MLQDSRVCWSRSRVPGSRSGPRVRWRGAPVRRPLRSRPVPSVVVPCRSAAVPVLARGPRPGRRAGADGGWGVEEHGGELVQDVPSRGARTRPGSAPRHRRRRPRRARSGTPIPVSARRRRGRCSSPPPARRRRPGPVARPGPRARSAGPAGCRGRAASPTRSAAGRPRSSASCCRWTRVRVSSGPPLAPSAASTAATAAAAGPVRSPERRPAPPMVVSSHTARSSNRSRSRFGGAAGPLDHLLGQRPQIRQPRAAAGGGQQNRVRVRRGGLRAADRSTHTGPWPTSRTAAPQRARRRSADARPAAGPTSPPHQRRRW